MLASNYKNLLLQTNNLTTHEIDAQIANEAAVLRAKYGLRTPDSIQVATAIISGCDAFLTNDLKIKVVTEIKILVLDELTL